MLLVGREDEGRGRAGLPHLIGRRCVAPACAALGPPPRLCRQHQAPRRLMVRQKRRGGGRPPCAWHARMAMGPRPPPPQAITTYRRGAALGLDPHGCSFTPSPRQANAARFPACGARASGPARWQQPRKPWGKQQWGRRVSGRHRCRAARRRPPHARQRCAPRMPLPCPPPLAAPCIRWSIAVRCRVGGSRGCLEGQGRGMGGGGRRERQ